jgi:hypothetical protein
MARYPPYIAHLEPQSKYKSDDAQRFMIYNVLVDRQNDLPVRTIVFLLRPEADGPGMRGPYVRQVAAERPHIEFHFRVVRVWEQPVESLLRGGVGMLPLAPLCTLRPSAKPGHCGRRRIF